MDILQFDGHPARAFIHIQFDVRGMTYFLTQMLDPAGKDFPTLTDWEAFTRARRELIEA